MGRRRTVQLGAGADRLARRRTSLLLLAAPVVVGALALMALGAGLAEFVADPSGLALHVPEWITVEIAVWVVALVVVGFVLVRIQRRYGTVRALLALAVLMGVALFAITVGELVAYMGTHGW
ncbi:MAG: hypothetical protein OXH15_22880 [Gammaproteobacteria bacterium]|nr:hypothetical protein [Gammaproteobacteria bacterium]